MREPTYEECAAEAYMVDVDGYACYSYQIGGYCSKSVVVFDDNGAEPGARDNSAMLPGGCFTLYLWHDGDFPYSGREPLATHLCDAQQFTRFGQMLKGFEADRIKPKMKLASRPAQKVLK